MVHWTERSPKRKASPSLLYPVSVEQEERKTLARARERGGEKEKEELTVVDLGEDVGGTLHISSRSHGQQADDDDEGDSDVDEDESVG